MIRWEFGAFLVLAMVAAILARLGVPLYLIGVGLVAASMIPWAACNDARSRLWFYFGMVLLVAGPLSTEPGIRSAIALLIAVFGSARTATALTSLTGLKGRIWSFVVMCLFCLSLFLGGCCLVLTAFTWWGDPAVPVGVLFIIVGVWFVPATLIVALCPLKRQITTNGRPRQKSAAVEVGRGSTTIRGKSG